MTARAYELMIIVDTDEDDAMVDDVVKRSSTWFTDKGGTVASVDKWGKRKFAYEINHKTDGHYAVLELVGEPQDMAPLERMLNLADEVVRHKLFRLPDHEALRRELVTAEGGVAPVKERTEKADETASQDAPADDSPSEEAPAEEPAAEEAAAPEAAAADEAAAGEDSAASTDEPSADAD